MLADSGQIIVMMFGVWVLDWLMGDPGWIPHPVNGIAALARRVEKLTRSWVSSELGAGAWVALIVCIVVFGLAFTFAGFASWLHAGLGLVLAVLLIATTVAARDLVTHASRVAKALGLGDLELAKERVSKMVGRDVEVLDESGVVRATVESVAESITDGIISPLFYATAGGLLGGPTVAAALAMFYRAANTLDSLFGYRDPRYIAFGKVPARMDDVLNYLPARISAFCLILAALLTRHDAQGAYRCWLRDARKHQSPNAGHTEAAMAGALGIQLGGPARYDNQWKDHARLGDPVRVPVVEHIKQAGRLAIVAEGLFVLAVCTGALLTS